MPLGINNTRKAIEIAHYFNHVLVQLIPNSRVTRGNTRANVLITITKYITRKSNHYNYDY